ncbi:hypothetical protein [Aliikangiella coralliicola]|nr:hypothetical protein [Aliikangiella coralliicola]
MQVLFELAVEGGSYVTLAMIVSVVLSDSSNKMVYLEFQRVQLKINLIS